MTKNNKTTGKKEASNNNDEPRQPDYKSDGIAVWVNMNKDGKPYLSIRITGHNIIYAKQNITDTEK